jgi:hypothetical protein
VDKAARKSALTDLAARNARKNARTPSGRDARERLKILRKNRRYEPNMQRR